MSKVQECSVCGEEIKWSDEIIGSDAGYYYHEKCVKIYPSGYIIFSGDDEFLGKSDDDAGVAIGVLNYGEYADEDEE